MTRRSIRRLLVVGTATFALATAAGIAGLIGLVASMRHSIERDTAALVEEQHIADRIVGSVYGQLFAAYRNLQDPREEHRAEFRTQGQHVYDELRKYLAYELPMPARLAVEEIKELHQDLEIAGQRAIDKAVYDESDRMAIVEALRVRATHLEAAVDRFVAMRQQEHERMRERQAAALQQLLVGAVLAAVLMLVGAVAFVRIVRRRLLRPVEQLALASQRMGRGDLAARIPPQPDAEFAAVARSFNQMAERVQGAHVEVSARNVELTAALDRLNTAQQELVQHEKLSALGGMLAGLAHELNNPLAGVLGMTEVLASELRESRDPAMHDLARELVAPMRREALRARDLVRNLLQFSRKSAAAVERVSVSDVLRVVVGLREYAFRQAGKSLVLDVPEALTVRADRQTLEHAILNVVNNALDAVVQDAGSRLVVRARGEGDRVAITFEDDGAGFRELERAFDPFYTTKPVGAGTGLGLTLVHKFLAASGGTVSIANATPRGACVTLRLPTAEGLEAPAGSPGPVDDAAPLEAPAAAHDGASSERVRALVVDDEATLRELQRRLLERRGYEVLLAADGAEACALLEREPVDVVITDVRMPGAVDGVGLYRWVARERPALADRLLFVTGAVHDVPVEVATLPPDRLLQKPFDRDEYLERVTRLLERASV